jgi:predicted O-linked N-acetylglucosamine transferase (SPINDLY family)
MDTKQQLIIVHQLIQRALSFHQSGNIAEADRLYQEVIGSEPTQTFAPRHLLGIIRAQQGRYDEALALMQAALKLDPIAVPTLVNYGNVLSALGRFQEALACFDKVLAIEADSVEGLANRGNVLSILRRPTEALASFDRALEINPDLAEVLCNRGNALRALRRFDEALASYEKAIALRPNFADAYGNRGNTLSDLNRTEEALADYDRAIALRPNYVDAYCNRGMVLQRMQRHAEAATVYETLLKLDPHYEFAKGYLLHQKMLICDWNGLSALIDDMKNDFAVDRMTTPPFAWQAVATSPSSLQQCAAAFNRRKFPVNTRRFDRPSIGESKKIRVGYLHGEFGENPVSFLLVGVLEHRDRDRFEIFGFDNGRDDLSPTRRRIDNAFDRVINIRNLDDGAAAAAISEIGIDVLVDLNGYCGEGRTGVFAMRPAPIQVNYLGYPGTMGANYMDYIIGDKHVIPLGDLPFYTEKVVYMPDCFQANDSRRKIANRKFRRAECGLPEQGFVFCCFNNSFKIVRPRFDSWMRILKQIDGSVFWFRSYNASVADNLKMEAASRGVDPRRLIFASRLPFSEHLARHTCADLFLDTLPFNAHTTASDALWAGIPVLTCPGETFAGRVAASLLRALDLPELIAATPQSYELMAIELATYPDKLAAIKAKLAARRSTAPLFDTALFARYLDNAYTLMYERNARGLPPDHIMVSVA